VDGIEELEGDFEGKLEDSTICSSIESASFSSLEAISSSEVTLPVLLPFGTLWRSFSKLLDDLLFDDI